MEADTTVNEISVEKNFDSAERADLLRDWIDVIRREWPYVRLMPLNDEKEPIIRGRCGLDTDQARGYLHTPEEATEAVESGHNGFFVYCGREGHGTEDMVICDRDEPDEWPTFEPTVRVVSGSPGLSDHLYFRGDVENAEGKGNLKGTGGIRAKNWGCVVPGSLHPSGGVYQLAADPGIATLSSDELPEKLRPGSVDTDSEPEHEPIEGPVDPRDCLEIENDVGISLREIREVSPTVERLTDHIHPGGYPSPSEADRHTAGVLLYYRFDERDIARIMRGMRARKKHERRSEYVRRTIRTTSAEKMPRMLCFSVVRQGTGEISPGNIAEIVAAIDRQPEPFTTADLVDSGWLDWDGAKRKSVMERARRAMKILAPYYIRQEKIGGEWVCETTDDFPEVADFAP